MQINVFDCLASLKNILLDIDVVFFKELAANYICSLCVCAYMHHLVICPLFVCILSSFLLLFFSI